MMGVSSISTLTLTASSHLVYKTGFFIKYSRYQLGVTCLGSYTLVIIKLYHIIEICSSALFPIAFQSNAFESNAFDSNQMHLNQMQTQLQMPINQIQMQMHPPQGNEIQVQVQIPHLPLYLQRHLTTD